MLVQLLSHVWLFATQWTAAHQVCLSITNSWSLLKFKSIKLVMPSNHLILFHPFLLLPSVFPSIIVYSNEYIICNRCPKYWSFSFSISPPSEYSRLISFSIDRFDHLIVQGTLKSLLQHHSSKVLILQHSAFFMVQLSHPYTTTGKTIALTRWTFVGKVMSLLFNMLSRLVVIPMAIYLSISMYVCLSFPCEVQLKKLINVCINKVLPWSKAKLILFTNDWRQKWSCTVILILVILFSFILVL